MHSFLSACAKRDRRSQEEYGSVWDALVSCTEGILGSGRGAVIEQVRKVPTATNPPLVLLLLLLPLCRPIIVPNELLPGTRQ